MRVTQGAARWVTKNITKREHEKGYVRMNLLAAAGAGVAAGIVFGEGWVSLMA